ncbi:hypothetical protein CsSME_00039942 [Camellia sinensis var. sinensis]
MNGGRIGIYAAIWGLHVRILVHRKCPSVLDWEQRRSWIAMVKLDCGPSANGIWETPSVCGRNNFTALLFRHSQANRARSPSRSKSPVPSRQKRKSRSPKKQSSRSPSRSRSPVPSVHRYGKI